MKKARSIHGASETRAILPTGVWIMKLRLGYGKIGTGKSQDPKMAENQQSHIDDRSRIGKSQRDIAERYDRLEANIPGMVYRFSRKRDQSSSFTYVNAKSRELFDIDPEALIRDSRLLFDLVHPDDRGKLEQSMRLSALALLPWREELRHIVNGEVRWHEVICRPEQDLNGDIIWDGIILEITGRKRAEEAIRASEQKFSLAFHASPNGHAITTYDEGRYIDANISESLLTGYSREELIGRTVLELNYYVNSEDRQRFRQLMADCGIVRSLEFQFRRKSGEIRQGLFSGTLIDLEGKRCILGEVADITGLRQAEDSLRISEERLRLALMAANQDFYDLNLQTNEAQISPEYTRILGLESVEVKETKASWFERMHPDDRDRVTESLHDYILGKIPVYSIEFRHQIKSGGWKWILSQGKIVEWDTAGKPLRMLGTHTDITELKRIQFEQTRQKAELDQKAAQLQKVNEALKGLLSQREVEIHAVEETHHQTLKKFIMPYVEELSRCQLAAEATTYLNIIKLNFEQLFSSSSRSLLIRYQDLTPKEIRVADLIRQGMSTKEIAQAIGISPGSVSFHRDNIRKKLGLNKKKASLMSFLTSLS